MTTTQYSPGDLAAVIRAYVRGDGAAFSLLTEDREMTLAALGMACDLLVSGAGSVEGVDDALSRVIEFHRQWE